MVNQWVIDKIAELHIERKMQIGDTRLAITAFELDTCITPACAAVTILLIDSDFCRDRLMVLMHYLGVHAGLRRHV